MWTGDGAGSSSAKSYPTRKSRFRCSTARWEVRACIRHAGTTKGLPRLWKRGCPAGWGERWAATTRWCSARWCADDAYIYDVVGLESEGTSIDFQIGANSYLYGTRFMTWLAKTYGPDKLVAWLTRDDNTKRFLLRPIQAGLRDAAGRSLEDVDRVRAPVAGTEPKRDPAVSGDHAEADHGTCAGVRFAPLL